jgi:hypothetical protein
MKSLRKPWKGGKELSVMPSSQGFAGSETLHSAPDAGKPTEALDLSIKKTGKRGHHYGHQKSRAQNVRI